MFSWATDDANGVIVGVFSGTSVTDADYRASIDAIEASDRAATARGVMHICILVTDHDTPRPSPSWRERMAASNDALTAERCFFTVVSPSLLIRGVFTAIQWIQRHTEGRRFVASATFEEAAEGARKESGRPLAQLEQLYAEAKAGVSVGSKRPPRSS